MDARGMYKAEKYWPFHLSDFFRQTAVCSQQGCLSNTERRRWREGMKGARPRLETLVATGGQHWLSMGCSTLSRRLRDSGMSLLRT